MSVAAIEALKKLWEYVTFHTVKKVVTRPENVLSIEVPKIIVTEDGVMYTNHTEYSVRSKKIEDIPEKDLWRAQISWKRYFGFTKDNTFFDMRGYHEMDFDLDITLIWGMSGNHSWCFEKPEDGALVVGQVENTEKGNRLKYWSTCTTALKTLIYSVKYGTNFTDEQLAAELITQKFPDMYWAVARLVLFDNVQAFVDQLKDERPAHPCFGQEYPRKLLLGNNPKVDWAGMFLPKHNVAEYVHLLSYRLGEPRWWEEFQRLAAEQGLSHYHPNHGGWCEACQHEQNSITI